jgi:nitrogen-specific signal transduction histidine kinase
VLESAFGQKDKALVNSLAEYKPAKEIKFDAVELKELLTLRGRASHAETSVPDIELTRVEGLCDDKLPRLRNLVERVILTKRTWGAPSGGIHNSPPPVMSYVNKDGGVVVIQNWKKQLQRTEGKDSASLTACSPTPSPLQ